MTQPITAEPSRDDHVDAVLADFFERQDRGEPIALAELIASHPDLEADLREFFDAAAAIEQLAGPTVAEQSRQEYWRETTKTPGIAETLVPGQTMAPIAALPHGPLPEKFGRYAIRRLLGEGAMGLSTCARSATRSARGAEGAKICRGRRPGRCERFFREARSAATLRSPNICPVYDVGTIDGQLYLSMAYIEGRSLAEELRGGRKFSLDQIALIIRKLAAALQKAHQLGIVHRDLKPGNVMLDADGEPVLMDFGLARRDQANDLRVTMSGVIVGTPAYMSPEQVERLGQGRSGERYLQPGRGAVRNADRAAAVPGFHPQRHRPDREQNAAAAERNPPGTWRHAAGSHLPEDDGSPDRRPLRQAWPKWRLRSTPSCRAAP